MNSFNIFSQIQKHNEIGVNSIIQINQKFLIFKFYFFLLFIIFYCKDLTYYLIKHSKILI